ncbi:hypothetical protein AGMMS50222_10280 [Endomicrobiia bacterium]|nr:hypothetical protein AGMMS50222_10280 [Endomicrobiia bacterium]
MKPIGVHDCVVAVLAISASIQFHGSIIFGVMGGGVGFELEPFELKDELELKLLELELELFELELLKSVLPLLVSLSLLALLCWLLF